VNSSRSPNNPDLVVTRDGDRLDLEGMEGAIQIARGGSVVVFTINHPRASMTFTLDVHRAELVARHVLTLAEAIEAEQSREEIEER
jgi:hypothetical protein